MSEKPVLLLDVDGVLNAVCNRGDFPNTWPLDTWHFDMVVAAFDKAWPIHWSTGMVDFINDLANNVEIRWHTTWQEDAAENLAPALGLKEFPIQESDFRSYSYNGYLNPRKYLWWKMQAAVDVVNVEKRPLIWIDDDLTGDNRTTFKFDTDPEAQSLLIQPFTELGLRPVECEAIAAYVEAYR